MDLRPLTAADRAILERLLTGAGLPTAGLDALEHGVVGCDAGVVVAAAGVEVHGDAAVLRSVVVEEGVRGRGRGTRIVRAAEVAARDLGVRELYLLTETAEPFFERLGYRRVERGVVPRGVAGSVEFAEACAETAIAMHRRLA